MRYIRATRRAVTDMVEYLREKKCPVQKMNLNFKDRESKQAVRAKLGSDAGGSGDLLASVESGTQRGGHHKGERAAESLSVSGN